MTITFFILYILEFVSQAKNLVASRYVFTFRKFSINFEVVVLIW